jgi:two-component system CheB/CheR fusion protein
LEPLTSPDVQASADAAFHGFVVAIGASAGGLDALERLFDALPADTGACFVVIQHLSPDHKSMMDNLLSRHTRMPVRVVEHEQPLTADAVYLIPPGMTMRLSGERLQLAPKPDHGLSLPIDIFFTSLAESGLDRAIAVVLSGTGSDGTRGVSAVNAHGGFVFVQEPGSAKFDGMPRSAVATGVADVVAPIERLADRLVAFLRSPAPHLQAETTAPGQLQPLAAILDLLLAACGIDFRAYKPATVLRRIERRMQVLHAASLADYFERLSASDSEKTLLRRELLIPVTRFFRDGDVFDTLSASVIEPLVRDHASAEPIRVWVACCATGEEAYSMAILFVEAFERLGRTVPLKIFATDVEPQYLEQAAAASFPLTISAEVTTERLTRFFVERPNGWMLRPEIRQLVIFARHNLVVDPPFTRMHLVSCRNALIYLQPAAQDGALRRLQYALRAQGHLLLGPSESLGELVRDFAVANSRHKLYRLTRRERPSIGLDASPATLTLRRHTRNGPGRLADPLEPAPVELGQRVLASAYQPPTLLIGPARELLHVYGDARALLRIAEGEATLDVLRLLPRELSWAAGLLLHALARDGRPQHSQPLRVGDGQQRVRLVARAVTDTDAAAQGGLVLLSLESLEAGPVDSAEELAVLSLDQQQHVEALELELKMTHQNLQATIEELETSNEELQATNEELMASNEELQSTNEELQSVNEELYTVNSEFQEKVEILNAVNADLENVSKAAGVPTLFVDESMQLLRVTPEAALLFKVRESDIGRSLEDFANTLEYPELFTDLRRTLLDGIASEREVRTRSGEWWIARMQPYTARSRGARRAVLSFFNITSLKDSQRLQAILDSLQEQVAVLDSHGTIVMVNEAWRRFARLNGDPEGRATGPGCNYLRVCAAASPVDGDARAAFDGITEVLDGRRDSFTLKYLCEVPAGPMWFLMYVAPVRQAAGGVVVSHVDITDWIKGGLS